MKRAFILGYHRIGERLGPKDKISISFRLFSVHMKLLRFMGLKGGGMESLGRRGFFVLSFDDGYPVPLEFLDELGFKGIVFRTAGAERATWNRELEPLELMDFGALRHLSDKGWEVGSHGLTHRALTALKGEELKREVFTSKRVLEEALGIEVSHFSYPYGLYNEEVKKNLMDAGYKSAVTTRKGWVFPGKDPFELPRIMVGKRDGALSFLKKLFLSAFK